MKNKNLKICFAIIMSFAVYSLKAQSTQQKFQKDMQERKKNVNTVLLKAKEQQAQQKAETSTIVTQPTPVNSQNQNPLDTQSSHTIKPSSGSTRKPLRPVAPKG